MPVLYILRHGQTEWNRDGIIQGWQNSPLTELGQAQAARQRGLLLAANVRAEDHDFHCSPLGRTRQTAEIALAGLAEPRLDPDLREITCGAWDGLPIGEVRRRWPGPENEEMMAWYDRAEGGEGLAGLRSRCARFLGGLADTGRPAVIVTHGVASRMLRALILGRDPGEMGAPGGGQGMVVRVTGDRQEWLGAD